MNCPKCFEPLRISDRQGIEIDYCPDCRGVWLDKGELDKIIERTVESDFSRSSSSDHRNDYKSDDKYYKKQKHHKKKHLIKEIFDLFD